MMEQFRVSRAIYPGHTRYYLQELDAEGYVVAEHYIRTEPNNISLFPR